MCSPFVVGDFWISVRKWFVKIFGFYFDMKYLDFTRFCGVYIGMDVGCCFGVNGWVLAYSMKRLIFMGLGVFCVILVIFGVV